MVTAKDVLIAGTVLTGVAALAGKVVPRRESPVGRPVSEGEQGSYHPHPLRSFLSLW